jgi:hypothetical protein
MTEPEEFYEDDEPVEQVISAFENGNPSGVTGPSQPSANVGARSNEIHYNIETVTVTVPEASWIQSPAINRGSASLTEPV